MIEQRSEPDTSSKKRILILCDFYLPSTKSGGGMRTVVNLVDRFADRYQFFVITRNHESRNDTTPFESVKTGDWNEVEKAKVFYLAGPDVTVATIASLVNDVKPHGVYLNSVFSTPAVKFLLARRRNLVTRMPAIVAPCGELSAGALGIKRWKKLSFLFVARLFGLYRGVFWKASSLHESREIRNVFGEDIQPQIAPDLPPAEILARFSISGKPPKVAGHVRLIFLSRIDRKKNLGYLIDRLIEIRDGKVELTIAGPVEDEEYWRKCELRIEHLPPNVTLKIVGAVSNNDALKLLTNNHFFVLPTRGENFGYVILEALAAGCPLIISDRTIWNDIEIEHAGRVISLDAQAEWESALRLCISMDQTEFAKMSTSARKIAQDWILRPENEAATAAVLEKAFGS